MSPRILIRLLAVAVAAMLTLAACGDDGDSEGSEADGAAATTSTAGGEEPEEVSVGDEIVAAGDFTTLLRAMQEADLVETLATRGPTTFFAPTEAALEAALSELGLTPEQLYADEELLNSVLLRHVVDGDIPPEDLLAMDGEQLEPLDGEPLVVSVDGDTVMVDDATVVASGVSAATISEVLADGFTGQIYAIDAVLPV